MVGLPPKGWKAFTELFRRLESVMSLDFPPFGRTLSESLTIVGLAFSVRDSDREGSGLSPPASESTIARSLMIRSSHGSRIPVHA